MHRQNDGRGGKRIDVRGGKGEKPIRRNGEPAGTRTQDPRLKRALLYQLSYGLAGGAIEREMDPCFRQAADSKLTQRRFWLQRRGRRMEGRVGIWDLRFVTRLRVLSIIKKI